MTKCVEMKEKTQRIYDYIAEVIEERAYPPTVRELCETFDIKSTSSAVYYLKKLESEGLIRLGGNKSRAIELTRGRMPKSRDMVRIPLLGSITAGVPKLAVEDYEESYCLPRTLFSPDSDLFMLTVEGTSMIDVGINDGDLIVVKKQNTAQNGQIVAALVEDDCATVKRFYKDASGVRLHPENKNMRDIYPTELTILGIVVGLIRTDIH